MGFFLYLLSAKRLVAMVQLSRLVGGLPDNDDSHSMADSVSGWDTLARACQSWYALFYRV